jgi:hypothetical protein
LCVTLLCVICRHVGAADRPSECCVMKDKANFLIAMDSLCVLLRCSYSVTLLCVMYRHVGATDRPSECCVMKDKANF